MTTAHYNKTFYDRQRNGSFTSACVMLPYVFEIVPNVATVTDIGCGVGTWLAVARLLGRRVLGRDFHPAASELLLAEDEFIRTDLCEAAMRVPQCQERYDLCLSLEVAEHLPPESAEGFVGYLCAQSDLVMFGAAIPLQGGTNHSNERWQSYWVEKFTQNGYQHFDVFRNKFWNNKSIEFWYIQNSFIFCNAQNTALVQRCQAAESPMPLDVIHPRAIGMGGGAPVSQRETKFNSLCRLAQYHVTKKDYDRAQHFMSMASHLQPDAQTMPRP